MVSLCGGSPLRGGVAFDEAFGLLSLLATGSSPVWKSGGASLFSQIYISSSLFGWLGSSTVVSGRWFFSSRPLLLLFSKLSVVVGEEGFSTLLEAKRGLVLGHSGPIHVWFVAVGTLWWCFGYGRTASPLLWWAVDGVSVISRGIGFPLLYDKFP